MDEVLRFATRLTREVLPEIIRWRGKRAVLKLGGAVKGTGQEQQDEWIDEIARDIVLLQAIGVQAVVVHGGGQDITRAQERLGITPRKVNGLRIYDDQTMEAAQQIFLGISADIVAAISRHGGKATILVASAYGEWLHATRHEPVEDAGELVDLGRVAGDITVQPAPVIELLQAGVIPVIAPLAVDDQGSLCGNADHIAAAVAGAIKAEKVMFLTDVDGIRFRDGIVAERVTVAELEALIFDGVVTDGMAHKAEACVKAIRAGAREATIANGKVRQVLIVEFLTDRGVGTMVVR